jgi:hypothetical protein
MATVILSAVRLQTVQLLAFPDVAEHTVAVARIIAVNIDL